MPSSAIVFCEKVSHASEGEEEWAERMVFIGGKLAGRQHHNFFARERRWGLGGECASVC